MSTDAVQRNVDVFYHAPRRARGLYAISDASAALTAPVEPCEDDSVPIDPDVFQGREWTKREERVLGLLIANGEMCWPDILKAVGKNEREVSKTVYKLRDAGVIEGTWIPAIPRGRFQGRKRRAWRILEGLII